MTVSVRCFDPILSTGDCGSAVQKKNYFVFIFVPTVKFLLSNDDSYGNAVEVYLSLLFDGKEEKN